MSRLGIWLMVVLRMVQVACADTMTLSIVEREVTWVAPDSCQIMLGINHTGSYEAVAVWQLEFQITPYSVSCSGGTAASDYIFSDSSNFASTPWDSFTHSIMFYDYPDPSQVPKTDMGDLFQFTLTSSGGTEPFDFNIAFVPYNAVNQTGSFWCTDLFDPLTSHPFDFSSIPEPSCIRIMLSGVAAFMITMVKRRKYLHRAFSSCGSLPKRLVSH